MSYGIQDQFKPFADNKIKLYKLCNYGEPIISIKYNLKHQYSTEDATPLVVGAWKEDGACPQNPACNSGGAHVFEYDEIENMPLEEAEANLKKLQARIAKLSGTRSTADRSP